MSFADVENQLGYIRYSKEEAHPYSPGIARLLDLAVRYVPDAEEAHANGRSAMFAGNQGWEMPLLYSNGIIPISYTEMGRMAGVDAITIAEDYYQFPPETCSMVKSVVGEWHLRKEKASSVKRVLSTGVSCEPFNMAWEIMKGQGYDIHTVEVVYRGPGIEVGSERQESLVDFFIDEICRTQKWATGSDRVDEGSLAKELGRKNRILDKLRRILDLRLGHPYYMKSLPAVYLLNGASSYFGKPEEYEDVLDELISELEGLGEEACGNVIPLIWVGGVGQEFGVYEAIDEAGAALLGFRNTPFKRYRLDIPPVEALARYLLDNPNGGASVYALEVLEEEIRKIHAKGLILQGFLGCTLSTISREIWREHFHQKGIPSINLEGTFQFGAPSGQLVTRTKAFIEMLS